MRTHADHRLAAPADRRAHVLRNFGRRIVEGRPVLDREAHPLAVHDRRLEHVHGRLADECGDEQVGGLLAQLLLIGELLQDAPFHHRDAIGQRVGLGLVMGDEDRRHAALDEEAFQAPAQDRAQLRLKLAHRLVEQIEIGPTHQRAGERARCCCPPDIDEG